MRIESLQDAAGGQSATDVWFRQVHATDSALLMRSRNLTVFAGVVVVTQDPAVVVRRFVRATWFLKELWNRRPEEDVQLTAVEPSLCLRKQVKPGLKGTEKLD